jgi:hypothetical protein
MNTTTIHTRNTTFSTKALSYFPTLFNSTCLCDVKLRVGTTVYSAHKLVLACSSETFRTMFSSGFLESGMEEIVCDVGQPEVYETFLQYIYGISIEISNLNVIGLYELAEYHQMYDLKVSCEQVMSQYLDLEHVCYIYAATSLSDSEFKGRCIDKIFKMDLDLLKETMGFKELPVHCITTLFSSTRFFSTEDSLYSALRIWMDENECDIESMLSLIHYDLLSTELLESIQKELTQYPSIIQRINDSLKTSTNTSMRRGVLGDYNYPADSALQILNQGLSRGDGIYWINISGRPSSIYCDMTFEGGGWMLVRRQKPGRGWQDNPADRLTGTPEYGYEPDSSYTAPDIDHSFGIRFNKLQYTHLMFKTGDESKWLICHRDQIEKGWTNNGFTNCIIYKSYERDGPYVVQWCKRNPFHTDPWVSTKDHGSNGLHCYNSNEQHSMLYGSQWPDHWVHHVHNNNGCNVWIR